MNISLNMKNKIREFYQICNKFYKYCNNYNIFTVTYVHAKLGGCIHGLMKKTHAPGFTVAILKNNMIFFKCFITFKTTDT